MRPSLARLQLQPLNTVGLALLGGESLLGRLATDKQEKKRQGGRRWTALTALAAHPKQQVVEPNR
jgi:hypothetical protein